MRAILSALAAADSGEVLGLPLDPELIPEASLQATIEAFAPFCRIERGTFPETLDLTVLPGSREESRRVLGELLNFLLRSAVHERFAVESA